VLSTIKAYPIETDVVIVTNKPRHMLNYRSSFFGDDATFRVVSSENKSDPYGLAWAHRDIATKAMAEGEARRTAPKVIALSAGRPANPQPHAWDYSPHHAAHHL